MLAGSLRFGAAALITLCVLAIPLSAQSPPPAMSIAERRAAFEQALQLRQAGRHQEALTALIKAGNAGERRAAALVAIAFEEGLGARAAAETAAKWHLVAATGSLTANVPVQIEWLGDGAIRYHVKPDHQRVTFRADGSWTRELLHERILVKDGADGPAGHDSTEYTIHEDASGTVTVTDWRGGWWSLTAPSPEDRLSRDERAGDLTFRNDLQQAMTIRLNGRRTIASDSGNIRRRELDAGGRLIGVYDAAGKAPNQYQHDYRGTAEGALWGMTPLAGDGQRWTLLNSADGAVGRHAAHGLIIESLRADRSPALDGQGRPRRSRGHAAVTARGDLTLLTLDPPALVIRHADGRVTEFPSAGRAAWKDPETGEVFAGSWHEVQQRLAAIGAAAPGLSGRHLDLAKTEAANRDRLTFGLFELEAPSIRSPRRPVPLVTQAQRTRAIASVMHNADGTTRIDHVPVPRPQPPPPR